jgi:hypothetical protein
MVNPVRDFEARVFDFVSNRYLFPTYTSTREEGEPYKVGEEFIASDSVVFKNNSRRLRKCLIRKVEQVSETKYDVYIEPTREDVKGTIIDIEPIDRSGEEGWLHE